MEIAKNKAPTTINRNSDVMGFYYRKSVGLGPFHVNLSDRGVGFSVGGKGCLLVLFAEIIAQAAFWLIQKITRIAA